MQVLLRIKMVIGPNFGGGGSPGFFGDGVSFSFFRGVSLICAHRAHLSTFEFGGRIFEL